MELAMSKTYTPGEVRNYGLGGGAVCKRCGRPYALNFFSPHLFFHKLARCPHCGKWTLARPSSQEALRAAEQAEVGAQPAAPRETAEEILRRQIEDSRMTKD
jgi:hypothetical protein